MNVGAASTSAPWLLFLHADSRLTPEACSALVAWLSEPPPEEAATFRFQLDAKGPWWRFLEHGQRLREQLTGLAYGDQGLLLSRSRWQALGGIPEIPLMEDVEAVRRLRRTGGLRTLDAPLLTSARRYRKEGPLFGWLRNATLLSLYGSGVPPERLARWYRPHRAESRPGPEEGFPAPAPDASLLLVFAKAPRPGGVKTRLAAGIGEDEAARLYRAMGREIVDRVRGGPFRVRVCHTPADAGDEVRDWLGTEGLEFAPQCEGDLGERMADAFDQAFRSADRVAIIGTDVPALDAGHVERAFVLLEGEEGCDAVFGPARDGGYYLLALRRPAPALFEGIPWSTGEVLERSLARAEAEGLGVRTLTALADIDRPEDLALVDSVSTVSTGN